MKRARAVVVGAGIGGLVAALELITKGFQVTVIERSHRPGGKMREIDIRGKAIDSGPTVFTMRWVFEEIFKAAGSSLDEHLDLKPVDVLARHAWTDGSSLDLFADQAKSAAAIAALSGQAEAKRYLNFCKRAAAVFDTLYLPYMRNQRPSVAGLVMASGWRGLPGLLRIQAFRTLWGSLGGFFRDPRLRGLFARYATYCGCSPLLAPATLMLIAHVEQRGVWQITGGMQRLAEALASLIASKGGRIKYDTEVSEVLIRQGRAVGARLAGGDVLDADVVIANTDAASIQAGQLGQDATLSLRNISAGSRSLSAVTWSLLAKTGGFDLAHHNVFFPDSYPKEFNDIFKHGRLPDQPAVYICAQDRGQERTESDAIERLFIIVNAPAHGDTIAYEPAVINQLEAAVFRLLGQCGLHLEGAREHRVVTTPADFERRFPGTGGALYGRAQHGWRSSFSRPGARSNMAGLYLTGGSVHPGAGVPMVAISGQLAARVAAADLGVGQLA